jgi:RNA binding exosome subunit
MAEIKELTLTVRIQVHHGEDEDEVFKHLSNLLYDADDDIKGVS